MKRWHYLCAAVLIAGSMAVGAGAADVPDYHSLLQSALPQLQQSVEANPEKDYWFNAYDDCYFTLQSLLPEQHLYTVSIDPKQGSSSGEGLLNLQTGKLIIPMQYDDITVLKSGKLLLIRNSHDGQPLQAWYADTNGNTEVVTMPVNADVCYSHGDGYIVLGTYEKKPVCEIIFYQKPTVVQCDILQFTLLDDNMNIIRDDLDGGIQVQPPFLCNGLFAVQTGSTQWEGSIKYGATGNGKWGLIDTTGQFVGKHDFDELGWTDCRFIGKRGTTLYQLDGKGGETQLPVNASQESSWAKAELEAARENDISISFDYPKLNITRVDFCRLAVKLYQKVQPNASVTPAAAFSDCEDESVRLAAALGIVTGYDDGTFRPYQSISRQEAAAMLDQLYTTLGGKVNAANDKPYADDTQLGDWARGSVYAMREIGVMQGKESNRFCPKDGYTQEQAVVTMERVFQVVR